VREGLDARSLLGERWHEWWNRRRRRTEQEEMLEPLDPTSARARYRELLHTVAAAKEQLARMPAETPTEYEQRLLVYLEANPVTSQNASHVAGETDSQLLRELTHAYILERYGGRQSDEYRRTQMPVWVARLVARLTGRAPVERTTQRASKHVRL